MASTTYVDSVTLSSAAEWNKWDTAAYAALSSVAGTNTITATGPANLTYVATNPVLWFIPAATNTGATTINITPSGGAALGAKNIFANGAACVGGEIVSGVPCAIVYDGTQFNIIGGHFPKFKTVSLTRDLSTATGTQAVTGVGFKPKAIVLVGGVQGSTGTASIGISDGTIDGSWGNNSGAGTGVMEVSATVGFQATGAGAYQQVEISSFDADGFTLSWTKTGSPTGTATFQALCMR